MGLGCPLFQARLGVHSLDPVSVPLPHTPSTRPSFPNSVWERTSRNSVSSQVPAGDSYLPPHLQHRFTPYHDVHFCWILFPRETSSAKRSFDACVPKRSLGTRCQLACIPKPMFGNDVPGFLPC